MTKVQRYKVGYYTDGRGMLIVPPRLIPDDSGFAVKFEDYCKLEAELAALKAELREICAAIDDPASDLTLTTIECVNKLKAENEWQPIETAPKDKAFLAVLACGDHQMICTMRWPVAEAKNSRVGNGEFILERVTHWMPLPKPPAMAQGEK